MNFETLFIWGLLLHLIGDYMLQSDKMAVEKTKSHFWAALHSAIHGALFFSILPAWLCAYIAITHFLIDRYRLSIFWLRLINWNFRGGHFLGQDHKKAAAISYLVMIAVDNTMHIICNTFAIWLHTK